MNEGPGDKAAKHSNNCQLIIVVKVGRGDSHENFVEKDPHIRREHCVHKVENSSEHCKNGGLYIVWSDLGKEDQGWKLGQTKEEGICNCCSEKDVGYIINAKPLFIKS